MTGVSLGMIKRRLRFVWRPLHNSVWRIVTRGLVTSYIDLQRQPFTHVVEWTCDILSCWTMFIINWFWDVLAQLGMSNRPFVFVEQLWSSSLLPRPDTQECQNSFPRSRQCWKDGENVSLHFIIRCLIYSTQTLLHMLKNDRLATLQPTLHPSRPHSRWFVMVWLDVFWQLLRNWLLEMWNSLHTTWEDTSRVWFRMSDFQSLSVLYFSL